jgi:hypothetical protein
MHMVSHTADCLGHAFDIPHHASDVSVQPIAPSGDNNWRPIFGAEDDVIMH